MDHRSALNPNGTGGRGAGRGGPNARGGQGNDGERHATIGATEVKHIDGNAAAAGQANNEEHQGGGHAGAGFGGGRYATGRGSGGQC